MEYSTGEIGAPKLLPEKSHQKYFIVQYSTTTSHLLELDKLDYYITKL